MIFKKLTLKNFMSYADATIDFVGIRTACLSGQNGAGKSSLLDAITWIIWEEGRAGTDDLVKLGTVNMSCELEFYMENDIYRIYRSRVKGKNSAQGKSNLEFQIFNPKENTWISLSRHTVKQTQELINKTLKMNHETFVNSVYLKQGRADEFTLKKPSERKQMLAEILGLSFYDDLCEKIKLKIKGIENIVLVEEGLIAELKEKISKEEDLKVERKKLKENLKIENDRLEKLKESLNQKHKELESKREKQRQIEAIEKSKISQKNLISTIQTQLISNEEKFIKCKHFIDRKDEIEANYKSFVESKSSLDSVEKKRELYLEFSIKKTKLDSELKEKLSKVESDIAVLKSKINDRSESKKDLSSKVKAEINFYDNILPQAEGKINAFKKYKESLSGIEAEGLELKHDKHIIDLELQKLEKQSLDIEEKIKAIETHNHNEPCPLCKSPILDKNKVINEYKNDLIDIYEKIKILKQKLSLTDEEMQLKRKEYASIKDEIINSESGILALSSQLELEKNEFRMAKEKIAVIDREINVCESELTSILNLMKGGQLAKDITAEIIKVEDDIQKLFYDAKEYEMLRGRLKILEDAAIKYKSLEDAMVQIEDLKKENKFLQEKLISGNKEIELLEELISRNQIEISDISILESTYDETSILVNKQSIMASDSKDKLVVAEKILSDIGEYKSILEKKKGSIGSFVEDKSYYEILEKAFGKNGIQVAIIETVVPEIEKEANRILSKLTDNQMHIALRTQKEKKSGKGLHETLDVIIADSVGTRSYELYSGGEAFKINFALRLAISRLLASRSGAKLQTLTIDEGFGSQDTDGKDRLVEIIKSIEGEFELILIVTHLDELKDSFSTQIQITKDEEGSKITMVA